MLKISCKRLFFLQQKIKYLGPKSYLHTKCSAAVLVLFEKCHSTCVDIVDSSNNFYFSPSYEF